MSLSGTVTSQSIDARGTTGVARSGLLVRATSNASTNGQAYNPRSIALTDAVTVARGHHTFKFGGEYRRIQSDFQFLGSTEITFNSVTDFIDNRPAQIAGRPVAKPADDIWVPNAVQRDRFVLKILDQSPFQIRIEIVLKENIQSFDDNLFVRRTRRCNTVRRKRGRGITTSAKSFTYLVPLIDTTMI